MSLKFGKTKKTLRLSQNYVALLKIKNMPKQAMLFDFP